MRALALEHLRADPVGIYGDVLEARGIEVDAVKLEQGEPLPDWRDYDLLVVMGGAMSVWEEDEYPWLVDEKRAIREAVLAGVPYLGVCLGSQLLAAAFDARVYLGPEPELGASQMFLTAEARRDPVFRGFPGDVEVFEFHLCHFELPRGAVRLARSPRYENQAIRYGRVAYAIQCHLEPSLEEIRSWFETSPSLVERFESRHGGGSVESFFDEYAAFVPFLQRTGRQLVGRWLENAIALGGLRAAAQAVAIPRSVGLVGRERERSRIDAALDAAREGGSAVLVLRGEAGSGKTALLDDAAARAAGLRVLRTAGKNTDVDLPFAGLAELCGPLAWLLDALPRARAASLSAALGLGDATVGGDRFAAYAGALELLTAAAEEEPLLILVDDADALDEESAEAIAFLAQRLGADGIALLVATEATDGFADCEELTMRGLEPAAARALLETSVRTPLAPVVAERVLAAARGNPLALLEIPLGLTSGQCAGLVAIDQALLMSAEWSFLARIDSLPQSARRVLLVAALADDGDLEQIRGACTALGLDPALLRAADGLAIVSRGKVVFRHSLVWATLAYSALRADRRAVHAALATATEDESRLWHEARAAAGTDEAIAAALENTAERYRERGACGAAANALELAARLTPEGDTAARRLLLAAGAAHSAGHVSAALDHLHEALSLAQDPALRLRTQQLHGRVLARSGSAARAWEILTAAAADCEELDDPVQAAELLADAVLPALRAGAPLDACAIAHRATALADGVEGRVELVTTLMLGTALVFAGDHAEGASLVDRAADLADDGLLEDDALLRSYVGAGLAISGRYVRAREVLRAVVEEARRTGGLGVLPYALVRLASVDLETGQWAGASGNLHEALRLAQETGQSADNGLALGGLAWLEAAQGRADQCRAHVREALELAERLGSGSRLHRAEAALGLLELGAGRPAAAIPYLEGVRALQREQGWSDASVVPHVTPDLIEAYVAVGRTDDARLALEPFAEEATRAGRKSALAGAARCRALLGDEELGVTDGESPFERARSDVLRGDRTSLEAACATFDALGATPWAERAREQLRGAGHAVPERQRRRLGLLTPFELELVVAVAAGASPREAGSRLFVGPRTAQLRLASAMVKLGARSPSELATLLGADGAALRGADLRRTVIDPSPTP